MSICIPVGYDRLSGGGLRGIGIVDGSRCLESTDVDGGGSVDGKRGVDGGGGSIDMGLKSLQ